MDSKRTHYEVQRHLYNFVRLLRDLKLIDNRRRELVSWKITTRKTPFGAHLEEA